jgi:hypothetical protein
VSLIEKHLACPYRLAPAERFFHLPSYVLIMCQDIAAAGFGFGGTIVHRKYPMIKILGTVWLSPQRETLVLCGAGTVAQMAARQTWLFTPLSDGRFLATTDQNDEGDQSGTLIYRRMINCRFPDLLAMHVKRLADRSPQVRSFREPAPFDALAGIWAQRTGVLMSRGRARWVGGSQEYWRYTVLGALGVVAGFFPQLADAAKQFWRVNRTPLGSHLAQDHDAQVRAALEESELDDRVPGVV